MSYAHAAGMLVGVGVSIWRCMHSDEPLAMRQAPCTLCVLRSTIMDVYVRPGYE